jgi:Cu(I)/Ag(I) efflux system membrane protein CusA/SilA
MKPARASGSNIMSLGGIAIAIGAMIDAAIVMIENAHKHLERLPNRASRSGSRCLIEAASEVGPALFFSLLIITVSFLPIFTLEGAGRAAVLAARLSPRPSPWRRRQSCR